MIQTNINRFIKRNVCKKKFHIKLGNKNCDASSTAIISLANECELAVVNSLQVKGFKIGTRNLAKLKLGVLYAAKKRLN